MKSKSLFFILALLVLSVSANASEITTILKYYSDSQFDSDNNGLELPNGVIDFSVADSITGNNPSSSLCTWWNVYDETRASSSSFCFGNSTCCSYFGLNQNGNSWDATFYTYASRFGSHELISANVAAGNSGFSVSSIGGWSTLSVIFAHSPSFDLGALNLTLNSPTNLTFNTNADNLLLNFTLNDSANVNYSLDDYSTSLGSGTSFVSRLNSTSYTTIMNGNHNLSINASYQNQTYSFNLGFSVNDTTAPNITLTPNPNGTIIISDKANLSIVLNSSELSNITYFINGQSTQLAVGRGFNLNHLND
jgi:hypothetical protein